MNKIYIFSSVLIFCISFTKMYLNFISRGKSKINKIVEFKNFLTAFYNVNNYKVIDILENEAVKIKHDFILKQSIIELKERLEKDEINDFFEKWDFFIDKVLDNLEKNMFENINIKENLKYYGKIFCTYEKENKMEILGNVIRSLNNSISIVEIEFNKQKQLNFKYLIVSISLVIVLSI